MLNYLWAGMIFIGILYAAFTGRMPDITDAALDSSKEAVTLCIPVTHQMYMHPLSFIILHIYPYNNLKQIYGVSHA